MKILEQSHLRKVLKERDEVRKVRIDLEFEEEQFINREVKVQSGLEKKVKDLVHKIDVVKLGQEKAIVEADKIREALKVKYDQH